MRRTTMLVVCTLALTLCAVYAAASEPADTLKVEYFANANTAGAPDASRATMASGRLIMGEYLRVTLVD